VWRDLLSIIVAFVIFAGLKAFDPFGTEYALSTVGTEVASRSLSAWYPYRLCLDCDVGPYGPKQTSVGLIGRELPQLDRQAYAAMIDRLVAGGARAIVSDVVLEQTPANKAGLIEIAAAIDRATKAGVKVVLGQIGDEAQPPIKCGHDVRLMGGHLADALACAATAIGLTNWLQQSPVPDRVYPLYIETLNNKRVPSLAWAAYEQVVVNTSHVQQEADDLFLAWGRGVSKGSLDCGQIIPDVNRGFIERFGIAVSSIFNLGERPTEICPYIPSFRIETLLGAPCPDAGCTDMWHLPVAGRTVFIGTDDESKDRFVLPPFGPRLPGVYTHATAFENLVTLEGHGFEPFEESTFVRFCEVALGVVPFLTAFILLRYWPEHPAKRDTPVHSGDHPSGSLLYTATTMFFCGQARVHATGVLRNVLTWFVAVLFFLLRILLILLFGVVILRLTLPNAASIVIVVFILELTIILGHHIIEPHH
jgi:hypothetical protein